MKSFILHVTSIVVIAIIAIGLVSSNKNDGYVDHECRRKCVLNEQRAKECRYRFSATKATATTYPTSAKRLINGMSPGPSIEVCLGDTIEVIVENRLSSEELSFHWHGLRQKASPHMDGVSMISQCPIMPYTSFRYATRPENTGTHFYHAHSVRQQGDGLYGSLIVRGPEDDPFYERVLIVSARSSGSLSELLDLGRPPIPQALILNGRIRDVHIRITEGPEYLFRFINANAFNCPVSFSIDEHNLTIRATDNHAVNINNMVERIIIFPGERFDLSIQANKKRSSYRIFLEGLVDCRDLIHEASLDYRRENENAAYAILTQLPYRVNVEKDLQKDLPALSIYGSYCSLVIDGARGVCSLDLHGLAARNDIGGERQNNIPPIENMRFVSFDVHSYDNIDDGMTDYTFNMDDSSYYPSFLSATAGRIGQMNRMSFEYPSSPILSQPTIEDMLCSTEKRARLCDQEESAFCQCTQILHLPFSETFDIVLIDEGFGDNVSHTFHAHGYNVDMVGVGRFDEPTKKEEIVRLNERGLLQRNNASPLRKDNFVVPNKGYIILRIYTDNIGYWLWEARSTGLYGGNGGKPTAQFVVLVGNRENLPSVPIDFPACGNYKSPASIFHDAD